jgi:hypothetical protein
MAKKPKRQYGQNASEQKIDDLLFELAEARTELRVEKQQRKQDQALEAQFRTSAWNELLAVFPSLKGLVRVLRQYDLASQALRGAPTANTMRVGHPELTSVEAAADWPGHLSALRASVQWANKRVTELANELDDKLRGREDRRPVDKPRCQRRECVDGYGKRQHFGQRLCGWCGEPFREAA